MPSTNTSQTLIHTVTETLAASNIGALLWGEHLLRTYGSDIPARRTDYKFLLDDTNINPAFDALLAAGHETCTRVDWDAGFCPAVEEIRFRRESGDDYSTFHNFPACHVHGHKDSNDPLGTVISLYRASDFLPPQCDICPLGPPQIRPGRVGRVKSHGRFMYANLVGPDPTESRGGNFSSHLDSALIPSPMYLALILIHLGMRDCKRPGARMIWSEWLMDLRECYLLHRKGMDEWNEKILLEPLRPIWRQAIDAQIDVLAQPRCMRVWRDVMWRLVGVDPVEAVRKRHWAFDDGDGGKQRGSVGREGVHG
ncbi:hypothetical protein BDW74DRAFT_184059 [Aspergillus multicolor]|uniref:uncharacterized protein n=1 Tax=Aspergillus multicolor TaxID=41759 RepID=UPI003CCDCC7F